MMQMRGFVKTLPISIFSPANSIGSFPRKKEPILPYYSHLYFYSNEVRIEIKIES